MFSTNNHSINFYMYTLVFFSQIYKYTFFGFFLKMDFRPLLRVGGSSLGVAGDFPMSSPLSEVWDVVLLHQSTCI